MSPVSPGAYCRDGGNAMTLRRIAAEVTQDQWDLIARLQTRAPELRCVAPVRTGSLGVGRGPAGQRPVRPTVSSDIVGE